MWVSVSVVVVCLSAATARGLDICTVFGRYYSGGIGCPTVKLSEKLHEIRKFQFFDPKRSQECSDRFLSIRNWFYVRFYASLVLHIFFWDLLSSKLGKYRDFWSKSIPDRLYLLIRPIRTSEGKIIKNHQFVRVFEPRYKGGIWAV